MQIQVFGKTLLTAVFALLFVAHGGYAQQPANAYDGRWWLSVSPEEQTGFLNGYLDCYVYEYSGPPNYWIENPEAAEAAITDYYSSNPSAESTPVSQAFSHLPPREADEAGGAMKQRHSIYDGDYWKQISSLAGPERGQLGFVEGYLTCHSSLDRNKGGVFSRTPVEYMTLISQWYRFDEYTDEIDRKRARKPIAEVLEKFKD